MYEKKRGRKEMRINLFIIFFLPDSHHVHVNMNMCFSLNLLPSHFESKWSDDALWWKYIYQKKVSNNQKTFSTSSITWWYIFVSFLLLILFKWHDRVVWLSCVWTLGIFRGGFQLCLSLAVKKVSQTDLIVLLTWFYSPSASVFVFKSLKKSCAK